MVVVISILVVYFAFQIASNLRPVADDYCAGSLGYLNPISYVNHWYYLWSGDIGALLSVYTLVAFPISNFAIGLGSAVAFIAGMLLVSFSAISQLNPIKSRLERIYTFLFMFSMANLAWFSYWFIPTEFYTKPNSSNFMNSILHWQTTNVIYVVIPLVIIQILINLEKQKLSRNSIFILILASFLVGGSGIVLAVSTSGLIALKFFIKFVRNKQAKLKDNFSEILVLTLVAGLIYISIYAPGAQIRNENFSQKVSFQSIPGVAIRGMFEWIGALLSMESLIAIIFGIVIALFIRFFSSKSASSKDFNIAVNSLALSYLLAIISEVSELFAYVAWWHELSYRTLLFSGTLTLGIKAGFILQPRILKKMELMIALVSISVVSLGIYSIAKCSSNVENRKTIWQSGPAPIAGISDREVEWVNQCWQILNSHWI